MNFIWKTVFYNPLYNLLMFFVNVSPIHDLGVAVILLTLLVKIILFPLSKKAITSQFKLNLLKPKLDAIKAEFPDKQVQAQKTFALYKEEGVNPFSSCLVLLIQLPILFALYRVFLLGLGNVHSDLLYSFISSPENIRTHFLGLVDMTASKNILFAVLAGVAQFFQLKYQTISAEKPKDEKDMQAMLAYSMTTQMKYILPVVIVLVSYRLPTALALYWIVSSLITLVQERAIRKSIHLSHK